MRNPRAAILKNKVSFIKFQKVDGSIRNMICTLDLSMIPKHKHPTTNMEYTDEQIRVFDIVAQGWRSMKVENIIEISEYGSEISCKIA